MPTGYTSIIDADPSTTFSQFLWGCVRAFGVAAHMKDESSSKKLERPQPSSYYKDNLANVIRKKEAFLKLTDAELQGRLDAEHNDAVEEYGENLLEYLVVKASYDSMAEQVSAWEIVNPEHANLKKFMLDQLDAGGPIMYPSEEPEKKDLEVWKKSVLDGFDWSINYYTKEAEKELLKAVESSKWLDDLIESVPPPFEIK